MKLLIKKKDGSVHIRAKSNECMENIGVVHPNKIQSWLALSEASRKTRGGTMEDIILSVIGATQGKVFKNKKPKTQVTAQEYAELVRQCHNKKVSIKALNSIVEVIEDEKEKQEEENESIKELIQRIING